jgi:hypothetical protein
MDFESTVSAIPPRALAGVLSSCALRTPPPLGPARALPKVSIGNREVAVPPLVSDRKKGIRADQGSSAGRHGLRYYDKANQAAGRGTVGRPAVTLRAHAHWSMAAPTYSEHALHRQWHCPKARALRGPARPARPAVSELAGRQRASKRHYPRSWVPCNQCMKP